MSAVHLKPCPYCGRAARYVAEDYVDKSGEPWPFAECDACNTGAPVEFWNTRAQPADQQGEPVAYQIRSKTDRSGSRWKPWRECTDEERAMHSFEAGSFNRFGIMRELRALYAQPATAKVDERAEFELWADRHFASADYSCNYAGVYLKDWMRHSFAAWQARAKLNTKQ